MLMLFLLLLDYLNTFRRLFAEGTFNAAFIPSYAEEKLKGEKKEKNLQMKFLALLLFF